MGLAGHLWLPYFDQPQTDVVVSAIFNSLIYINIVTEWKHGICNNNIIPLNEKSETFQHRL